MPPLENNIVDDINANGANAAATNIDANGANDEEDTNGAGDDDDAADIDANGANGANDAQYTNKLVYESIHFDMAIYLRKAAEMHKTIRKNKNTRKTKFENSPIHQLNLR
jgi:hypothetical protein